jgi:hypothetical protein
MTDSNRGHKSGTSKRRGAEIKAPTPDARINSPVRPRLLPLKAAAQYLGLTVWGIRERAWAGQLPVVTFPGGRKWYFDVHDLDRFVEGHKRLIE